MSYLLNPYSFGLPAPSAYGGNNISYVEISGNPYFVHSFTATGTQNFVILENPITLEYLVIGGGGSGGAGNAGGGGAGGYRSSVTGESSGGGTSAEQKLSLSSGTYSVTVGTGGAAKTWTAAGTVGQGNDGGSSTFYTITATGGGGGGNFGNGGTNTGRSGGSGGGGGGADAGNATGQPGAGTASQGYAGGTGSVLNTSNTGGGGGGAASVGEAAPTTRGGNGGSGITSSITGTAISRAGGGGGGARSNKVGGTATAGGGAGGGTASTDGGNGTAGTANTGGGGGGAGNANTSGAGGSGVVIVRYPANSLGIVTSGLVFHLDASLKQSYSGTGSTWYDIAGSAYNSTLVGSPTYNSNGYFSFNGTNQTASALKPNPNITGQITVEAWYYSNVSAAVSLLHKGSHFSLQVAQDAWVWADSSNYSYANFGTRSVAGISPTGVWKQIVATKDSSNAVRIYKNGVLVDTRTGFGGALTAVTSTMWLNGYSDTDTTPTNTLLNGNMSIARVYNRALSDAEILQNFNANRSRYGL